MKPSINPNDTFFIFETASLNTNPFPIRWWVSNETKIDNAYMFQKEEIRWHTNGLLPQKHQQEKEVETFPYLLISHSHSCFISTESPPA